MKVSLLDLLLSLLPVLVPSVNDYFFIILQSGYGSAAIKLLTRYISCSFSNKVSNQHVTTERFMYFIIIYCCRYYKGDFAPILDIYVQNDLEAPRLKITDAAEKVRFSC